mmetsp:Transcript_12461/g.27426  ORF Transcript_12461/g.27426 Transcript_12461/m.27426 type:complete len:202 (+) Transcript_12461:946-1551(+)
MRRNISPRLRTCPSTTKSSFMRSHSGASTNSRSSNRGCGIRRHGSFERTELSIAGVFPYNIMSKSIHLGPFLTYPRDPGDNLPRADSTSLHRFNSSTGESVVVTRKAPLRKRPCSVMYMGAVSRRRPVERTMRSLLAERRRRAEAMLLTRGGVLDPTPRMAWRRCWAETMSNFTELPPFNNNINCTISKITLGIFFFKSVF